MLRKPRKSSDRLSRAAVLFESQQGGVSEVVPGTGGWLDFPQQFTAHTIGEHQQHKNGQM